MALAKTPRKKYLVHILVAALAILAASCGSSSDDTSANGTSTDDTAEASSSDTAADPKEAAEKSDAAREERLAQSESGDFPEIKGVDAVGNGDGTWTIEATVSSPYDTPERYADAWRVLDQEGNELGVRELDHDHADEQPFTRELEGVAIPEDVKNITVEGRDSVNGWGGQTFTFALPGPSTY